VRGCDCVGPVDLLQKPGMFLEFWLGKSGKSVTSKVENVDNIRMVLKGIVSMEGGCKWFRIVSMYGLVLCFA
jgi:hypothetical protein